ncbi:hypothetical protein AMELA_G00242720 [Ameiurus melas]|uniref:Uncharacterized protein n=1 Tax=Ameiurus melas TaxID=219545 RepID=A0A7J5ZW42_AMEME|nr:hypothetical protein AMELA_G00242720 [Ameiurus melas]
MIAPLIVVAATVGATTGATLQDHATQLGALMTHHAESKQHPTHAVSVSLHHAKQINRTINGQLASNS